MYNHLNLKILIHIFTIICLIMIIIIMIGENFVVHRCAAEHRLHITALGKYWQELLCYSVVLRMRLFQRMRFCNIEYDMLLLLRKINGEVRKKSS
jgi:hypothetical protein